MSQLDAIPRSRGNYDLVVALFVSLLLISNVAATKLIAFGPEWSPFGLPVLPVITDGGALLFPLTYVLGDVLAEVFGMRGARRAILLGFGVSLLASLTFLAVGAAPAAPGYENQEAFVAVLGFVPRIVTASLAGYLVGQFLNAWVLVKLKQWRDGRGMWARLLGSTVVGEAADTTIFCLIAFGGEIDGGTMLNYIVVGYVFKVSVEAVLLPITYRVIALVRCREPELTPVS
ncbi:queuosine precursor transporter [Arachnia rubra]|uniref:Probable queuosine precursor transporter n=1 Tax=Arachnia rubra TaxID=1547448 RepID=A0ABX7Y874_9ACTN|nr:queuosine precursor transporter [Arachnia rubra]MBB1570652.1 queuosine precursor transporter [Propionibacterium sp.]MDO4644204.1 queuosine precursor transporter [Propionibacteriaceae bacterium]QUC09427.1 queuosine precursor transporter [Arachnia rubra]BCR80914.1 membrane protein [Arachnia rubra]